jgi:hypothetical protein
LALSEGSLKLVRMTRAELLRALVRQAKTNGFEFRKWYALRIALPWSGFDAAIEQLSHHRQYYALLFSHEFVQSFWREGSKITFVVPVNSFTRVHKNGSVLRVERKGHTRRTVLPGAWRFHLKAMAVAEDPLRYIRRFLLIEEDLGGIQDVSDSEDLPAGEVPLYESLLEDDADEEME